MFVDRPAVYDDDALEHEAHLYLAKHRSGRTGCVDLEWDGATTSFRDPHSESGEPSGFRNA